uniref:Uncharacterized protein n=1 Tax=Anguilla anguilla TaxID=7936 RepID=A0A0E9VB97_ANGAN
MFVGILVRLLFRCRVLSCLNSRMDSKPIILYFQSSGFQLNINS